MLAETGTISVFIYTLVNCLCDGRMRSTMAGSVPMGHSITLYMLSVPRALLVALWLHLGAYKGRESQV